MNQPRFEFLLDRYIENQITEADLHEFLELLHGLDDSELDYFLDKYPSLWEIKFKKFDEGRKEILRDRLFRQIAEDEERIVPINKIGNRSWRKWMAVAIILIIGGYLYLINRNTEDKPRQLISKHDITLPNDEMPTIVRSGGKEYHFSKKMIDSLPEEGLEITEDENGQLLYKISEVNTAINETRTFLSPKGSSLQLELSDGTRLWLNSGASVTYPAQFSSTTRDVSLLGEVFLMVSHDKDRPFKVHVNGTAIKVLGTQFNVRSDRISKNVETTLVEGSVEVSAGKRTKILKPGLRSISNEDEDDIVVDHADLKEVLAWKDGYFRFTEDQIETVIAKVRQWYDISEVRYIRKTNDRFTGMIKRTRSLSELLSQIEKISNYKFKIEDGRVLIM